MNDPGPRVNQFWLTFLMMQGKSRVSFAIQHTLKRYSFVAQTRDRRDETPAYVIICFFPLPIRRLDFRFFLSSACRSTFFFTL